VFASGSDDKTVRVWVAERAGAGSGTAGELLCRCVSVLPSDGESWIQSLIALPDGSLVCGTDSGDINVLAGGKVTATMSGHRGWVWGLTQGADGRVWSASFDGYVL